MNRKQRRAMGIKGGEQKEVSETLAMFDKLPDECTACLKPFSKKSREMAMTWNVVVRDESTVRLYCPDCWNTAMSAVESFKQQHLKGEEE